MAFRTRRGLGAACFARVEVNQPADVQLGKVEICPESVAGMRLREEPRTQAAYPVEWCTRAQDTCEKLAGVGVRSKRLFGLKDIKVYAVGLYVDPRDVQAKVRPAYGGSEEGQLEQKVFEDVMDRDVKKTVRLVVHYGKLTSKKLIHALRERCEKPLAASGKLGDLEVFETWFENLHLKKGLAVAFSADRGMLVTRVEGRVIGQIDSPELCRALFDIYLGKDPVSPDAKEDFGKGVAGLLGKY